MERIFALAPMMSITDRHFRVFMRHIFPRSQLYTEMISTGSIIHGSRLDALGFDPIEHPVGIQLGGSSPNELAFCSRIAQEQGYDEINLNIGCPSDRVQSARFGACLMAEPELVASCVEEIRGTSDLPVTIKTRIGIDKHDDYEFLADFITKTASAGCNTFFIHARKAWLKGLSPRQNRSIPPLEYDKVYRVKEDFPNLRIIVNGGIRTLPAVESHLEKLDGVMIGREANRNPWFMKELSDYYFENSPKNPATSREAVVRSYMQYIEGQLKQGVALKTMARHLMGIYHGQKGARHWRRMLCEDGPVSDAGLEVVESALQQVTGMQAFQHS
ncbi:MAG: tRNA dihydrouridine(20/20a) synthase DusA [Gammaproteobacteria bacterium]|nr:tRNA dihydrouridine(20/20a) synthase DusA [Gammaproteobacteria bacterium]